MKDKNGITLIALIITIIVMLILVAVTINLAVNGGLFGYASNAARETEVEKQKETRLSNVPGNLSTDGLVDYYTRGEVEMATFTWVGLNGNGPVQEYEFEVGMTWAEWIDSSYNPHRGDDAYFFVGGAGASYACYDHTTICCYEDEVPFAINCTADEEIYPGISYGYYFD